jgi:hypothetical protein
MRFRGPAATDDLLAGARQDSTTDWGEEFTSPQGIHKPVLLSNGDDDGIRCSWGIAGLSKIVCIQASDRDRVLPWRSTNIAQVHGTNATRGSDENRQHHQEEYASDFSSRVLS